MLASVHDSMDSSRELTKPLVFVSILRIDEQALLNLPFSITAISIGTGRCSRTLCSGKQAMSSWRYVSRLEQVF